MINNIEYASAYSEVLEILKYIPLQDYNKIPETKIKIFENNANKNHKFNFNPNRTFEEQNISIKAKAILGILFRDYWATEDQKEKIINKQNYERKIIEKEKLEKYNYENLFKQKMTDIAYKQNTKDNFQNNAIVEYKQKNLLQKLFDKIKNLFKKI